MSIKITWRTALVGAVLFFVAFAVVGSVSVLGWEYSNSNHFCAYACHAVHPEEPKAHRESFHAEVNCVECHIGRLGFFHSALIKSGHVAHAWSMIVGYERPLYAKSFKSAENTCFGCHTKTTHQVNLTRTWQHFAADEWNTETKLTMTLRNVGRIFGGEDRRGMNWHTSGAVKIVAEDPQKQHIALVEATLPSGEIVTYKNVKTTMSDEQIAEAPRHVMDCADCHNRAGHPFPDPERVIDKAFASGELSRKLPFVKQRILEVLHTDVASEEEARERIREGYAKYEKDFPGVPEQFPEEWARAMEFRDQREDFMVNLMVQSSFIESEDVDWRSFPDNLGHKNSPGCFRCHSGRLQTVEGKPIPVNCSTCHSLPLITKNDRIPQYYLELLDQKKPPSHKSPSWISRHMFEVEDACSMCHGEELRYGTSNKTFCSNSGCHGEEWEFLDLSALE